MPKWVGTNLAIKAARDFAGATFHSERYLSLVIYAAPSK